MCGIQILKPSFLNELAFSILENTTSPPGPFGYFSKWRLSNRHFEKYAEGPEDEVVENGSQNVQAMLVMAEVIRVTELGLIFVR